MFRACDTSGDNKVTLEEYLTAMGEIPPKDHKYAMCTKLFCYYFLLAGVRHYFFHYSFFGRKVRVMWRLQAREACSMW